MGNFSKVISWSEFSPDPLSIPSLPHSLSLTFLSYQALYLVHLPISEIYSVKKDCVYLAEIAIIELSYVLVFLRKAVYGNGCFIPRVKAAIYGACGMSTDR